MRKQSCNVSVNVCTHCRKNLSITADMLGYRRCAECLHFEFMGVYTIEDYNNYLSGKRLR